MMETILLIATVNLFMWFIVACCAAPIAIILLGWHLLERINKWEKG